MTSVGIDVGTSTTKLIVSSLRLAKVTGRNSIPKYQIVDRRLLYSSPIYPTPLKNHEEIDIHGITAILEKEYTAAQVSLAQVKSGAVIITGETATKKNAEQIVHFLAERAGDFVVAVAGADLEAVLAGKGSGALARSTRTDGVIANIDIGGGTANTSFFQHGKTIGTVTFHVGGRLIRLDQDGTINYVSSNLRPWLQARGYLLREGDKLSLEFLEKITWDLCKSMLSYLFSEEDDPTSQLLLLDDPAGKLPQVKELMVSGGVGQLMLEKRPASISDVAVYGDIGPILAHRLADVCRQLPLQVKAAEQTVRATVIGAGMESTEISGSTVYIDALQLPIRNLPVCKIELPFGGPSDEIISAIQHGVREGSRLFGKDGGPPFAIALGRLAYCSFATLQSIASELAIQYRICCPDSNLLVVITLNDCAKALGQALTIFCQGNPKVICIDQIDVEHWNYIDLGEPIANSMIPVMIKTLAFHNGNT